MRDGGWRGAAILATFAALSTQGRAQDRVEIPLPGCGASQLAAAGDLVVVGCYRAADVRFVDPRTARVVATVDLPGQPVQPAGLAIAPDRGMVYVVTDDLRIVELDAATQTATREVTTWQRADRSCPSTMRSRSAPTAVG